jgi:hypothetical protein
MIKTEIKMPPNASQPLFPLLARLRDNISSPESCGTVVLFTDQNTGVVILTSNKLFLLGECSSNWAAVSSTQIWEILPKGTEITVTVE